METPLRPIPPRRPPISQNGDPLELIRWPPRQNGWRSSSSPDVAVAAWTYTGGDRCRCTYVEGERDAGGRRAKAVQARGGVGVWMRPTRRWSSGHIVELRDRKRKVGTDLQATEAELESRVAFRWKHDGETRGHRALRQGTSPGGRLRLRLRSSSPASSTHGHQWRARQLDGEPAVAAGH
jgi:hypothetical protein